MGLLDGKVAIVTGAGGGIGRCHALALAAEGARVVVNDLGSSVDGSGQASSMADQVVAEIKARGGQAVANYDSVAEDQGAARLIQTALDAWGRADILVNNAGILRDKTLLKLEEHNFDLVVAVHLKGTFLCTQHFVRHVKERADAGDPGGRIINTSSYAGLKGNYGQTNYAGAKAGIYGMTLVWSQELTKLGITANCLAPMAKTRMTEGLAVVPEEMRPEQVAPMAVFLASDLAKDVNGRVFGVHGQQLLEYRMEMTPGVTKAGEALWTPAEIAARLAEIGRFGPEPAAAPAAAAGPVGDAAVIAAAFRAMPKVFLPDKAGSWKAVIQFDIAGASPWTVTIADGACTVAEGKQGTATCTVTTDAATYAAVLSGKEKAEKAFMAGKIKASNLADMMKLGGAFDMKKARDLAQQAAPAAAAPATGAAPAAATGAAPAAAPSALMERAFALLPEMLRPDAGWDGSVAFSVAGAGEWTVSVKGGRAQVTKGLAADATCRVDTGLEDYARVLSGELRAEQAFMQGRIKASNLTAMMGFGRAFDMRRLQERLREAPAPGGGAAAGGGATARLNRDLLGKVYAGQPALLRPEQAALFAQATQDANPRYRTPAADGSLLAPPMVAVRQLKEVLFKAITDEDLKADLLRLVHGEQDMEFLRPLHVWDLCATRSEITGIELKSSGELLSLEERLYSGGELAVRVKASMFIRDPQAPKKPKGAGEAAAEAPARPKLLFSEEVQVAPDQSLRYAEASLDNNPIHTDPEVAKLAGFPGVILQGLCTMSFAAKAIIDRAADGDPTRLARLAVRFSKPVLMGDRLTTEVWSLEPAGGASAYGFRVVNQDGAEVITGGRAEVRPA